MFAGSAQNRTRSQKVSKRSEEFPQEKSALCMKKKEAQSHQSWRAAEAAAEAATQQTEATARTKTATAAAAITTTATEFSLARCAYSLGY